MPMMRRSGRGEHGVEDGPPKRTADEQALVDAWQLQPRLPWLPRLKDGEGEAAGTVVPDTWDMPLWGARLAQALGVDEPWLLDMLL
jgi:hypothetical protein